MLSAAGSELHKYPCPTVVQYQASQKQTNQLLITIKHQYSFSHELGIKMKIKLP
jgi:hypothetical protein